MSRQEKLTGKFPFLGRPPETVVYQTEFGRMFCGDTEDILQQQYTNNLQGRVNLIFTSPPFPLNRKKEYGNHTGEAYIEWLTSFGPLFKRLLTKDGSIVIELGNAWAKGKPVMSTLAMRALLNFIDKNALNLCQEFVWFNPAKLPTPAQWVNIERIRLKDSYTKLWWLAPTERPKASNSRVLKEYSDAMKKLLTKQRYNSGRRPSQHSIGKTSFLADHGGAIPPNVITIANTRASDRYTRYCQEHSFPLHPARMPIELASFFINFLTEPGDLVFDPFAGSNTTGAAAEQARRFWVSIERNCDYAEASRGRFAE